VAVERLSNVKDYYRRITEIDIGTVARELLGSRVMHESDRLLQCDCPNHKSQSHRSLHVMLDKQGWYCFGCGCGGGRGYIQRGCETLAGTLSRYVG